MLRKNFAVKPMEPHTLSWWRSRQAKIDMDPPYQRRGRLWSKTDKQFLIDSILNDFDVPKFYMADFTWGESPLNKQQLPFAIIDGKQRLEAIFDFFGGAVALNENFVFLDDPSLHLGGLGYKDLKSRYPQVAEIFDEYSISVMRVVAQDEEPINELFVRLNRSKPLTGAEIRNAMSGPAVAIIRQLAKHDLFEENISFPVKRGQDLNAAIKVLYFENSGELEETKKASLDGFVQSSASRQKDLELSARKVLDVFDRMNEIFLPKDPMLGSAGVFPVYYWLVRNRKREELRYLREFLVRFEQIRKVNRERKPEDPKIDNELLQYDRLNRSTDDVRSHAGRFSILSRRFTQFSKAIEQGQALNGS